MEPIRPGFGTYDWYRAGFTLIELMVVLAIIITITGIVLTNQSTFNKSLLLANTSYDIALTLRSAETYGLSSRIVLGGITNAGYGLHFQNNSPGLFTLFADNYPPVGSATGLCHTPPVGEDPVGPDAQPGDCVYNSAAGKDVKSNDYTLGNGIVVSDFCVFPVFGGWKCASGGLVSFDIVFSRPNPDAFMSRDGVYDPLLTKACLTISSPQGGSRFVSVAKSGQIIANAPSCP